MAASGVVVDVAVDGEGDGNRVVVVKASETVGFDVLGLVAAGRLDETALAVCARYLKKKEGRRLMLLTLVVVVVESEVRKRATRALMP